jgi:hypothetical protein
MRNRAVSPQLPRRRSSRRRVELLDNFLSEGGLNITQFPLQPKKK